MVRMNFKGKRLNQVFSMDSRTARIARAFALCDLNSSGFLEAEDIAAVCKAFDDQSDTSSALTEEIFNEFDISEKKKISVDEWTNRILQIWQQQDDKSFNNHFEYLEAKIGVLNNSKS
uniref:EF-hand domain-containing protein n=1 Tax=Spongospora subterranea TaxID=70186 RepID=A0A0H5RCV8_9EUKA|eukprot:CRZ12110.1 hypothetical protein [Spongospora subterranea]